jgi:hypothetical protein
VLLLPPPARSDRALPFLWDAVDDDVLEVCREE